jgi:hypothetical protein
MEIKINKNREIIARHKLKKSELYSFKNTGKFQTLSVYTKPQIVSGISNVTEDNKGILFADYDCVDESVVLEDYRLIQRKFKLPQAYLFKTKSNNFHFICLKKFAHSKVFEILTNIRCDSNYVTMPLRNPLRSYILRISGKKGSDKPNFIKLIGSPNNLNYKISSAHKELLTKLYSNIKHPDYKNIDKLKIVRLQEYETK